MIEWPFVDNKFTELFNDDLFVVATGIERKNSKEIVAIRWIVNPDDKQDVDGYPVCKAYEPGVKYWVRIQKCLLIEFLEILKNKNGAKVEEIEKTIKRIKENEKDFI